MKTKKAKKETDFSLRKASEDLAKRSEGLQDLLLEFGLRLAGFDPGVLARGIKDGMSYNFDRHEWEWLEPLLAELRRRRNEDCGE
jgi:hypothetical protein